MTELTTAPSGAPAQAADKLAVLRNGAVVTLTMAQLADAMFAAALSLSAGALAGRPSNSAGPPQEITLGAGLAMGGNALLANGRDHLGLTLLPSYDAYAELIVNSAGRPARMPLAWLRASLPFVAGDGVTIDSNGVITFAVNAPAGALLTEAGVALRDEIGAPILV